MNTPTTQTLLARYEGNRVIRGLIQLIPFGIGGAIDVVLARTLTTIREQRSRAFFDELAKGTTQIDPAELESEDFLHCYFATARYALNSRHREKIRMFARLLKSSVSPNGPRDVDEYEIFLEILDELNYRELQALTILDSYSSQPWNPDQNDLQWTNTFWDDFSARLTTDLNIPQEEIRDFMNRISRTGCYEMFTGTYLDYTGGKGKLTPRYRRLKQFIEEQEQPT
ncbi:MULTISPECIES: hypothetical protein [unclassified Thiobacillus]|uniref:hypothetical protein n=1 Tax=unclassified Thiobacillus TaxID=2646513 RepID=UPI001AC0D6AE|nr:MULTISPECIES: hypothetical protein [unclassified Thiobacillus]MBN8778865.1 hypothetical protein [Thiobacillus sp.]